jgi:hypothetical protein
MLPPPRTFARWLVPMHDEVGEAALTSVAVHPAQRRGVLVELALNSVHDLPTVGAWAREAGICEAQLRLRCRLAGVTAKISPDLVRVLRAVS